MDMYQKRKIRTEKKNNNTEEISKTNINWYIPTNVKPLTNTYK